jgi:uncharacterized protein
MHAQPTLEVRNPKFAIGDDVPKQWHARSRSVTAFFNNLSSLFPVGERFFIASVKAHRDRVSDETLLAAIEGFCGQEGIHGREHVRYNRMLIDQGYPVAEMEESVVSLLSFVSSVLPMRSQLAATCALEHFTALLAEVILGEPKLLEEAHPVMAELWRWHAAEENEHKSVAFDVYEAAGGWYGERVAIMWLATVVFWAKVFEQQARLMRADGDLFSPGAWGSLVDYLFFRPGGMFRLARLYLAYYRPGFHPTDIDATALLERWKAAEGDLLPRATRRSN